MLPLAGDIVMTLASIHRGISVQRSAALLIVLIEYGFAGDTPT